MEFAIMQQPGPAAHARRERLGRAFALDLGTPRPKRAGTVEARTATAALEAFAQERYVETGNRQYVSHAVKRGVLHVTLANGRSTHVASFMAWKH